MTISTDSLIEQQPFTETPKITMQPILLLALTLCLRTMALSKDAPIYNYPYSINFEESVVRGTTQYKISGKMFYDSKNNRERVDRTNGRYDLFCGSVLPNQTIPCQQYTMANQRWIIFPTKSICCFCCDAQHGCGITKPDWLKEAVYAGEDKLNDGDIYEKWSKDGDAGYNYFWVTNDGQQIPRKLDENGQILTDFSIHSFENQTTPFDEGVFALPSYCNEESYNNCPLQSTCGQFRTKATIE